MTPKIIVEQMNELDYRRYLGSPQARRKCLILVFLSLFWELRILRRFGDAAASALLRKSREAFSPLCSEALDGRNEDR